MGDISESLNYGLNASATEFDGENKYIRITDIDDNSHKFIQSGLTSPNTDLLKANDYLLKEGDILFARTGASVGKTYQYQALDGKVYYAGFLVRARIKPEIDSSFIFQNTLTEKYKNFIQITSQRSGQPGVNAQEYASFSILVPSRGEQTKLGVFFNHLDETIALHQRKLEKLQQVKKAMLEKMFPKNGSNVPNIRFTGFTNSWEQRKLKDHAKYRRGSFPQPYGNKEWYGGKDAKPFVQVIDVGENLRLVNDTKQKISRLAQPKSVFVPSGKVVVTLQGSIGRVAITQYDSYVDRTLLIFDKYQLQTNKYFWAYTIQQKFEIEKQKAPGGTIKTITKEALSNFEVFVPQYEEQERIGPFFKKLDETIALQQRELELLQRLKTAYLQKLFV